MKNILLIVCFIILSSIAFAQNKSELKGVLIDSLDRKPMELVTVSVTNFKDSSFVSYASTSKDGIFSFKHLPSGKPIVVIASMMGFSDYVKVLTLKEGETLNLGTIEMKSRSIVLGDVVVKSERQAIVINHDTITFNVEAFKVRPNAVVEELLKKLPGVQVDNDGTITVNGKSVSKITIDGKEFFGNDPKIASQNLNADLLDKIQIFDDRENDPDHLIEDANVSKIINLKFKKAFKKSVFGKIYAGGGTRDRYETGGLINMFRDTLQVSLIGVGNNLNKTGFSRNDLSKMGGFDRSGTDALNDVSVGGRNYGIENIKSGGFNINNDYGKKLKMNLLYFYSDSKANYSASNASQQFLKTDTLSSKGTYNGDRSAMKHYLSGLIQWKPSEKFTLRYEPKFSYAENGNFSEGMSISSNSQGLINENENNERDKSDVLNFSHNFTIYKALKKKGESLNIRHIIKTNSGGNQSFSNIDLVSYSANLNSDTVRRLGDSDNQTLSTTLFVTYRYPFTDKLTGSITTSGDYDLNDRKLSTFDQDLLSSEYDIFLTDQSSNLKRSQFTEKIKGGITYKFNKTVSMDLALENQWIQIKNEFNRSGINNLYQNYFNLLPTFRLTVGSYSLNYSTSIRQPSIYNIQPITIQTTQLYAFTGNRFLKPTKTHNLSFNYNKYYPTSQLNIYAYTNASIEENSVVTERTISNEGKTTSSPININGNYNVSGNLGVSKGFKKIDKWQLRYNPSIYISQRRSFVFLNQNKGYQNDIYSSIRQGFSISWNDLLDLSPSYSLSPRITSYDISGFKTVKYVTHNFDTRYTLRWPKRVYYEGNYTYSYNPLTSAGFRKSSNLLNVSVAVQMFKKDKGEIKLSCYDILNQNVDTYRYASENSINDYQSTILRRYFLLTYTFKFNKTTTK